MPTPKSPQNKNNNRGIYGQWKLIIIALSSKEIPS